MNTLLAIGAVSLEDNDGEFLVSHIDNDVRLALVPVTADALDRMAQIAREAPIRARGQGVICFTGRNE